MAGINGTILAIVIAALSGYLFMVYQAIHRMQTEVVDQANVAREYRFGYAYNRPDVMDTLGLDAEFLTEAFSFFRRRIPALLP